MAQPSPPRRPFRPGRGAFLSRFVTGLAIVAAAALSAWGADLLLELLRSCQDLTVQVYDHVLGRECVERTCWIGRLLQSIAGLTLLLLAIVLSAWAYQRISNSAYVVRAYPSSQLPTVGALVLPVSLPFGPGVDTAKAGDWVDQIFNRLKEANVQFSENAIKSAAAKNGQRLNWATSLYTVFKWMEADPRQRLETIYVLPSQQSLEYKTQFAAMVAGVAGRFNKCPNWAEKVRNGDAAVAQTDDRGHTVYEQNGLRIVLWTHVDYRKFEDVQDAVSAIIDDHRHADADRPPRSIASQWVNIDITAGTASISAVAAIVATRPSITYSYVNQKDDSNREIDDIVCYDAVSLVER